MSDVEKMYMVAIIMIVLSGLAAALIMSFPAKALTWVVGMLVCQFITFVGGLKATY